MTADQSNAESIVTWLKSAQYATEAQHRINIACDCIERLQRKLKDIQLDRDVAVDFIEKVYEAVHCKAPPPVVNLLQLADETVGEIERWKVLAP